MGMSKVDTNAELPYRVSLDIMKRIVPPLFLVLAIGLFLVCLKSKDMTPFAWVGPIWILLYSVSLQFRNGKLLLDENGIRYSTLFKKGDISWSGIDQVISGTQDSKMYGVSLAGSLGRVKPSMGPYLMILTRKDGGDPFLLNIKPYSVRGIATMVYFLKMKAPNAQIDEKTLKIMDGIFPSIFFGEAKGHG